jgi:threonine/homoserine/homoserine lactone efflux protein
MKPSKKINILFLTGSALMLAGVFAKSLGIPSDFEIVPSIVAVVFFYLGYRVSKKAKTAGEIPAASISQKQKKFRVMVIACAFACATSPFVLPYSGVVLPFWELVLLSVISFFMCVGIIWLTMRLKR